MTNKYDEIINMPRHISLNRKKMSLQDRCAQFTPFSALTGYEEAISEAGRETSKKVELSEEEKDLIRLKLNYLNDTKFKDEITFVYFIKDSTKDGGTYKRYTGVIHRIDSVERTIYFNDKTKIKFNDIIEIKNEILNQLFTDFVD